MDDPRNIDRRSFLRSAAAGAGALCWWGGGDRAMSPHFAARAQRVLYLHMVGAPSQHDLFDHKPALERWHGQDLPDSVRQGQRITTMTSGQKRLRIQKTNRVFAQRGACGAWISDLLPFLARCADELAIVRSMQTDAINHEPAINLLQTGSEQPGRPCFGAWLAWALGADARDLPAFVVLHSTWSGPKVDQPLYSRLWGAGFLPAEHQGVLLRSQGDPVLFLQDPPGVSRAAREQQLAAMAASTRRRASASAIPASTRASARPSSRSACRPRCRSSSTSPRSRSTEDALRPRRRNARHVREQRAARAATARTRRTLRADLPPRLGPAQRPRSGPAAQCRDVDQPIAGAADRAAPARLLDDTLVVWTSEFGRTVYAQGDLGDPHYGRDHHPRCFVTLARGRRRARGLAARRDRRARLQHGARSRARARPQRDAALSCSASTTRS
jgi:hypothetical protein